MINRLKDILIESKNMWNCEDIPYYEDGMRRMPDSGDVANYLTDSLQEYIDDYEDVLPNLLKESKELMSDQYVGSFDVADFLMTSIDNLIKE